MAYLQTTSEGAQLKFSAFSSAGALLATQSDLAEDAASDLWGGPVVVALPEGYATVWTDRFLDGDQLGIGVRRLNHEGQPTGSAFSAASMTAFSQHHPDAIWTGASLVVAWEDDADVFKAPDLRLRVFNDKLAPMGPEISLAATGAAEASVALAAFHGSWAAAWRAAADGMETISVTTAAGAVWNLGPFPVSDSDERPALVALDDQRLLLAYTAPTNEGDEPLLYLSLLEVGVEQASEPVLLPPIKASLELGMTQPALGIADGTVYVSWRSGAQSKNGVGEELWLKAIHGYLTSSPDLSLPEVALPRDPADRPGDQRWPGLSVGGLPDQRTLVASWEDLGHQGTPDATGARVVTEFIPLPLLRKSDAFSPEASLAACHDGVDNDDDGPIDCDDDGCAAFCETSTANCQDGLDNDGDGKIDCAQRDCIEIIVCPELGQIPGACSNGLDDDKDGFVDISDPGCIAQ